ncbi:unnamed protein product [Allacma fusca]|uniref:C2H2-type domain-containing protein n=1 Tax=Allacma fusca TaxID=39272 RepID=A0A8J2K950_9HEXA|nr:unnamed protein product [Allacma fusca]
MENKSAVIETESKRELWFLCSFCYRAFLSVKKLTMHKIENHGVTYNALRNPKERTSNSGNVRRSSPRGETLMNPVKGPTIKETVTLRRDQTPRCENIIKKWKTPRKFHALRKTSRKTKLSIHKKISEKPLLKKVLIRNWLKAVTPSLLQHTSLFSPANVDPSWQTSHRRFDPSFANEDVEYSKLEQLGSQLNSWLQYDESRKCLLGTRRA